MGVRLILVHPKIARLSCQDCIRYLTVDGEIIRKPALVGLPMVRPPGSPTPCYKCPKIPVGTPPIPANAVEISPKNRLAWLFDCECRAVGKWPDDPIVRRNAAIIRQVRDDFDREPLEQILNILMGVAGGR